MRTIDAHNRSRSPFQEQPHLPQFATLNRTNDDLPSITRPDAKTIHDTLDTPAQMYTQQSAIAPIQNRIDESVRKEQLEHSKKRAMALSIENENRELYVAIELTTCAGSSRSACKRSSWRTRSTAI